MKKMSVVTVLVMLVTLTAYSVSGTYARYTSQIDMTDEARIAKWEFKVTDGKDQAVNKKINLFKDSYVFDGVTYVKALANEDGTFDEVVAPGTTGDYTLKLSGNMETRYSLNIDLSTANDFVVYYSLSDDGKSVIKKEIAPYEGALEYHPLRYTIKKADGSLATGTQANMTFAQVKAALAAFNGANNYEPGVLAKEYTLSWVWASENTNDGSAKTLTDNGNNLDADLVNVLDTFAGEQLSTAANKVVFDVIVSATQVTADPNLAA